MAWTHSIRDAEMATESSAAETSRREATERQVTLPAVIGNTNQGDLRLSRSSGRVLLVVPCQPVSGRGWGGGDLTQTGDSPGRFLLPR